jgi:hypothetical protein
MLGDLHMATYDFHLNQMYVSIAGFPINPDGSAVIDGDGDDDYNGLTTILRIS